MFAIVIARFQAGVFLLCAATIRAVFVVTRMFDSVTDPHMAPVTLLLTIDFCCIPPESLALVWAARALVSLAGAPTAPMLWAMYAGPSEWTWGRRATGWIFSVASFAQKPGRALRGAAAGWLPASFGIVPSQVQDPATVNGIKLVTSWIPAAGAPIATAAVWILTLDKITADQMGRELEARRARESGPDCAPETSVEHLQRPTLVPPLPTKLVEFIMSPESRGSADQKPPSAPGGPGWTGPAAQASKLSVQEQAALDADFQACLKAGIHGLCFSPYVEGQAPGEQIGEAQIRQRLEIIRPTTRWVRTFSCTDGLEQTPRIAHELGMKTLVGAWLGTDRAINQRELDGVIAVAKAGHADIVAVGNEVMLREDLSEDELLGHIEYVKRALPGVQVGYVDAYFLFEKHPRITAACDVVLTNCYPFWEGVPREHALPYMKQMLARTRAAAPGKRIVISETGWPDQGSAFRGSVPSVEGTKQYFVDTMRWTQGEGIEVFWFAAFDEAWKIAAEGDVGAYWGLWDKDGKPKFT